MINWNSSLSIFVSILVRDLDYRNRKHEQYRYFFLLHWINIFVNKKKLNKYTIVDKEKTYLNDFWLFKHV